MKPTMNKFLFPVMATILLLAACAPTGQPQPTQDPSDVEHQVATSVALTVAAQNTQTEAAKPADQPATNTPLATQTLSDPPTPTPLIPTATPFEIVPPTSTRVSGGGGVVVGKADYACDAINRKPRDNTYYKPNAKFDIKWTLVNTGTKAWPAGWDLKYFSGPKMSTTPFIELPAMAPGDKFEVDLDGVAPSEQGFAVMTWTVEGQICYPYVAIIVEK